MKRCPQCHRVEPDDALAFCRADGTALVVDPSPPGGEARPERLGAAPAQSEIETSILPHTTEAAMNRDTASTTGLPLQRSTDATRDLTRPKRSALIAGALIAAALLAVAGHFLTRKEKAAIESIAVLPFVNESGNTDAEYLSDGMTETLIGSLSQLPNLNVKARSSVFRYKRKETKQKNRCNKKRVRGGDRCRRRQPSFNDRGTKRYSNNR